MKIYAISVIKNEADVIAYNLEKASEWSEKIFVYDNGSTDETWDIVNDYAKNNAKIIPWKQDGKPFSEGLRGEVYNQFKRIAKKGDWWCCRLDADEFYIDNPLDFLTQVPKRYHYVCKNSIDYWLTFEDLEEGEFEFFFQDNIHRIKYYNPTTWSEPRFFRHRDRLKWNNKNGYPTNMGIVYPKKIMTKHYQYRSPSQIQKRLDTRRAARHQGFIGWNHAKEKLYTEKLRYRADLILDKGNGEYPNEGCRKNIKHSPYKLIAKYILHGLKILP